MRRRNFLQLASAALSGCVLPSFARADQTAKPFRFAHLTDIHVQPELSAADGFRKCLAAVNALDVKPEVIVTGGDMVMDVFAHNRNRADKLFALYSDVSKGETDIPFYPCIGNHDVFGWSHRQDVKPEDAAFGKGLVCEKLSLEKTYYAFDQGGWRFYILDDIQMAPDNRYQAYIDEEQLDWLTKDLEAKPAETPALVVSHIPIYTVTTFDKGREDDLAYRVGYSAMCRDAPKLGALFGKHNVKLALSGHHHQLERIEYNGVTYICGGAVCGSWWRGPYRGMQEGFGLVDLNPDGTFAYKYVDYGWNAVT
ncbi:metallophosphoesterase [Blastopirellula sp. JC732]|uniref:Metallophosphoesterase n=1 Tax=Blastopirellula sediminis TaxID=2894196 RepID=A0A9X1SHU5_9BACT|nr:metallophosphoesterase [Blastopirellula sediminis]MCC9609715.1 metallophosphoesterase [Blastopirellula sediminis]MCC9627509.1 metallophosphoesterase [Blastopirellula sediminis]